MKKNVLAKELLNAVWEEDSARVKHAILKGADPSWIFNGYPILMHAVYLRNLEIVMLLIDHGAIQAGEALGFALEQGIGEMVWPLAYLGVVPKEPKINARFGLYPSRFAPTTLCFAH